MRKKKKKFTERLNEYENVLLDAYPLNSRYAEAFRSLRTNILFSVTDRPFRSLLITSAGEKEGKTSMAINLAHNLCNTGKSVLIVDADLRNPIMSSIFSARKSIGLTDLISERLGAAVQSGDLNGHSPSDLIRLLELQKSTGILQMSDGGQTFSVSVRQGEMVDIQWPERPGDRKLAQILLGAGKITQDQARMALSQQKTTGQRFGEILISTGILVREDLAAILSGQMLDAMQRLLQVRSGTYEFRATAASDFDLSGFNPVDFKKLYRQAVVGAEKIPFLFGEIRKAVVPTKTPGLHLLPSGGTPPNPSELLGSHRMPFLLAQLQRQFDVMVIDTPPILPVSDALLLAPQVDGVALVVKSGQINRRLVASAVEQLQMARANLLGVILNQVDTQHEGYYRYYYQKYYSGYYGAKTE
jgi:Mrp family chromosome partitioning ATPase